jgi:hypothetical protein
MGTQQSKTVVHYKSGLLFDCSFFLFKTILSGTGAHGECATFDVWVEAFEAELLFFFFFILKKCEYPMHMAMVLSDLEISPDL